MIKFEQLIAGGLSIFGKLESLDIEILTTMLKKQYDQRKSISRLFDYISIEQGTLLVRDNLGIDEEELTSDLRIIAGTEICEFLDNLDLEQFALRKIAEINSVDEAELEQQFSEIERRTIQNLIEKKLLAVVWNDDIPAENYREIKLTQRGYETVFCEEYEDEITIFEEELTSKNFDQELIPDFLYTQDLSKPACAILTIENFRDFCQKYDRCELAENLNSRSVSQEIPPQKVKLYNTETSPKQ